MELPNEFFTSSGILTFGSCVAITFIIANTFQKAFNFNPRWFALVIAIIICLIKTYTIHGRPEDYLIALLNGCLVFLSAVGGNQILGVVSPQQKNGSQGNSNNTSTTLPHIQNTKRDFFTRWF